MALILVGSAAAAACAGGQDTGSGPPAVPVERREVLDRVTHAFDGVSSVRTETEITSIVGSQSALVLRAEAWAELGEVVVVSTVSEQAGPGSTELTLTEETVLVDGVAHRRTPGGAWRPVEVGLAELVVPSSPVSAGGVGASLERLVDERAGGGAWSRRSDAGGGPTRYQSAAGPGGETVEVVFAADGHLTEITMAGHPAGVEVGDARRFEEVVRFTDLDSTTVALPQDLPAAETSPASGG